MAGIVLAGGRSSRMGTDKALLPWGDITLIESVAARLAEAAGPVLAVADAPERYAARGLPGIRVIGDHYPGAGPLGGIITGLSAAGSGWHLVAACDMPDLQPAVLRLLLSAAAGFDAAVPEIAGRLEPLCAAYSGDCVEKLRASLESGNRAVHRALESLRLIRVPEPALRAVDPALRSFRNLNTRQDYENALAGCLRER